MIKVSSEQTLYFPLPISCLRHIFLFPWTFTLLKAYISISLHLYSAKSIYLFSSFLTLLKAYLNFYPPEGIYFYFLEPIPSWRHIFLFLCTFILPKRHTFLYFKGFTHTRKPFAIFFYNYVPWTQEIYLLKLPED